jgi:hypothetical protein
MKHAAQNIGSHPKRIRRFASDVRFRGRYWGVKRTWPIAVHMSAFDPKRTSANDLKVVNFEQTRMGTMNYKGNQAVWAA